MKNILFILSFILFVLPVGYAQQSHLINNDCIKDERIIGTGTTGSLFLPFRYVYNHSYSQQIFTAEEVDISPGDLIESISFDVSYISGGLFFGNQSIFLGYTTKNHFLSTSDWVPLSELIQVYSGTYTYTTVGWNKIEFDVPFIYEGGNLVVAALHNFGSYYTCACPRFNVSTTDGSRAIYYCVDSTPINPGMLPAATGLLSNRSNVKFGICYIPNVYNIDMEVLSISGNSEVTATETHNYTLTVKNNGLTVSYYIVEIVTETNEVISQIFVTEQLAFNSTTNIEIPVTFTEEMIGELNIKGRVEVEDDAIPENNETQIFTITVIKQEDEICEPVNDLTSEKPSNYSVLLTWTEPESSLTVKGYRVYRNEELQTEELQTNTYYFDNELSNGVYEYYVITFYENECISDSSNYVKESVELGVKGVKELEGVILYPNPTTHQLSIVNCQLSIDNVEIFDVYGRKVLEPPLTVLRSYDLTVLHPGIYFVKITTEKGTVTQKIIKY